MLCPSIVQPLLGKNTALVFVVLGLLHCLQTARKNHLPFLNFIIAQIGSLLLLTMISWVEAEPKGPSLEVPRARSSHVAEAGGVGAGGRWQSGTATPRTPCPPPATSRSGPSGLWRGAFLLLVISVRCCKYFMFCHAEQRCLALVQGGPPVPCSRSQTFKRKIWKRVYIVIVRVSTLLGSTISTLLGSAKESLAP